MKIEGYLYIPYQGQFRFRFDTAKPIGEQLAKSDGVYDDLLKVPDYTRGTTCKELHRSLYESIYAPTVYTAIVQDLQFFAKAALNTVKTIDVGSVKAPVENARIRLALARID